MIYFLKSTEFTLGRTVQITYQSLSSNNTVDVIDLYKLGDDVRPAEIFLFIFVYSLQICTLII